MTLLVCSTLLLTSLAIADLTLNYTEVEFQLQPRPRDRTRLTGYLKWDTIEGEFHDSGRCFDPSSSASGTTVVEITLRPLLLPAVQLQDGPTRHEVRGQMSAIVTPAGGRARPPLHLNGSLSGHWVKASTGDYQFAMTSLIGKGNGGSGDERSTHLIALKGTAFVGDDLGDDVFQVDGFVDWIPTCAL